MKNENELKKSKPLKAGRPPKATSKASGKTPAARPSKTSFSTNSESRTSQSAGTPTKNTKKTGKTVFSKLALMVVFLLAVVFIAAGKMGDMAFSNVTDGFKSFFSSLNPGDGYPYTIKALNIGTINRISSDIFILNRDSVKILNSSAKEILSAQHTYAEAETEICNGRAIVYDRPSGRFKVFSRSKVLLEKDMSRNIFVAAIGKKGNLALAVKSDKAQSELVVFDKNMKQVFDWKCASERISAVALSDNGKSAAAAVVGAKNAELYSRLIIFEFDKSKVIASFDYPGTALIKVKFGSSGKVLAIGDNLLSIITEKTKQKADIPFGSGTLHRLDINENGKTAVILSSFGNLADSKLMVFGDDGEKMFEKNITEPVNWLACDKNYTSVLLEKEVQCFNNNGSLTGSIKTLPESEKVLVIGKNTYVLTNGEINRYSTVGKNE